ncbi:hypothetical protein H6P81_017198 [Aristolochia fimbriata]|uniref:F-box domain-containing protein n=1 Tax=Aristolochia fimbriata TaxID=158543 RepID=A0AAV7DYE2_ARIFI|nr:hypothetical protein H6P81_017198 [Aristolochia fimbriata]
MEKGKKKAQSPEWSQLDSDLLVDIFNRLTLTDLLAGVSHVCEDWRMAASKTRFFLPGTGLDLRLVDALPPKEIAIYINLLRSCLLTETTQFDHVQLPEEVILPNDVVIAIARRSTAVKSLQLPQISVNHFSPSLLAKTLPFWTNLTSFEASSSRSTAVACIRLLNLHCNNLAHLGLYGLIEKRQAQAIVSYLPGIESLDIRTSFFSESALDIIIDGLKNLKKLNLRHAICGDDDDMCDFTLKVLQGRGAKKLKKEVRDKLKSLEQLVYCGGETCRSCSWFYKVDVDHIHV